MLRVLLGVVLVMVLGGAAIFRIPIPQAPQSTDPTSGLLPVANDIYANWKNAGLLSVGGYPSRTTQCGATVTPSGLTPPTTGDDAQKIQAAITACTVGDFVQLAAGTFNFDQSESITISKGITVKGSACTGTSSPYCSTELIMPNGALPWIGACGVNTGSEIGCQRDQFVLMGAVDGSGWQWSHCQQYVTPSATCATPLDADGTQGQTTVQVHSTTPFSVGMWVLIDEASGAQFVNDPMNSSGLSPTIGNIYAASDWLSSSSGPATGRVAWMKHNPTIGDDDYGTGVYPYQSSTGSGACNWSECDRPTSEIHLITAIGAGPCPGTNCTLTFDDPLTVSFRVNGGTPFTGTVSSGSTALTVVSGSPQVGCIVAGTGIPLNDYIASGSGTSFTMKVAATANETSEAMTYCAHAAQVYYPADQNSTYLPFVQYAGLENVSILRSSGAAVEMEFCAYCWLKNVEAGGWERNGVQAIYSARDQIDSSYIWGAYDSCNNGDEYPLDVVNATTELLMQNSSTKYGGKGMTARAGGAGSVMGYNYFDDQFYANARGCIANTWIDDGDSGSHAAGSHHMLFEGNWSVNLDNERTHGNNVYHTYYRNFSGGYRSIFTDPSTGGGTVDDFTNPSSGPLRGAGPQAYNYWHAFIGNVLGTPGSSTTGNGWVYQATYGSAHPTGIWLGPGWYDSFAAGYNDPNLSNLSTAWLTWTGNYDYVNAAVEWNPSIPDQTLTNSFYLSGQPSFFGASGSTCSYAWPWVTPTAATKLQVPTGGGSCGSYSGLPVKARFDAGTPFVQP